MLFPSYLSTVFSKCFVINTCCLSSEKRRDDRREKAIRDKVAGQVLKAHLCVTGAQGALSNVVWSEGYSFH